MTGGKRILLITVVGLAVSIMVWLTLKQSPASSQSLFKLTILTTGEELGYIEPCGCAEDQNGGLSRRDSFIKSVRKESSHLLVAGNGDVIGKPGRQEEIKYEIAMTAMHEMGYDTLNVGEGELLLGIQQLQRFKKINRFSMVSANLLFEGRPLFERYVIKAYQLGKNEVKVAIIGIISKSFEGEAKVANSGFSILDPITALEALKEELTDEADVVILLAHTTLEESKKLAVAFPWIDVIVSGHRVEEPESLPLNSGQFLLNTGTQGKHIGKLELVLDKKKKVVNNTYQVVALSKEVSDSQPMLELLMTYQEMIKAEDLLHQVGKERLPKGVFYVGSLACQSCHTEAYEIWKNSKHAHAYETLVKEKHQFDPECIVCHTVGFQKEGGFISYEETPELTDVGCESCHGPGSSHIENPVLSYGQTGESTCLKCHTPEQNPSFRFEAFFNKIAH